MISFQDAFHTCQEKWNHLPEDPSNYTGSSLNLYLDRMKPHLFNNCDQFTNGEYTFYKIFAPLFKTVVDVGVRNDVYYVEVSDPSTHMYLFEPHPVFFQSLQKTIEEKGLPARYPLLSVLNLGVSDTEGTLPYYEKAESFVNRWNEQPSQHLPVVRLDSLQSLQQESEISFLKVDTEGFELNVLRGAEGILGKIHLVQFEYGGTYPHRGIRLNDVVRYLQTHGFSFFYYLQRDGLFTMDSQTVVEHEQYSNILASKVNL